MDQFYIGDRTLMELCCKTPHSRDLIFISSLPVVEQVGH